MIARTRSCIFSRDMTSAAARATIASRSPEESTRATWVFAAIVAASGIVYSFRLGYDALGGSEAYSAWVASKPGVAAIVQMPVLYDPGKQVFYYIVLHYFTAVFGLSEIALRSMSVIFAGTALILTFALG